MGKKRSWQVIPGDWFSLEQIIKELGYRVLDSSNSLSSVSGDITLKADKVIGANIGNFDFGYDTTDNILSTKSQARL